MIHKDIRIEFELDGRRFAAVGFRSEARFERVDIAEVFRRTDTDGTVVSEETDYQFIWTRRERLPQELRRAHGVDTLLTKRAHPGKPNSITYLEFVGAWWCEQPWPVTLPCGWSSSSLVLCHVP